MTKCCDLFYISCFMRGEWRGVDLMLPQTGEAVTWSLVVIGLIVLAAGIALILKGKNGKH